MNREEIKQFLPILVAFSEGKVIEYRQKGFKEDWREVTSIPNLSFNSYEYRIKPSPKYRPFANAEECWKEMLKHQPVGWIKHDGIKEQITCVRKGDGECISFSGVDFDLEYLFENAKFYDGAPFGVKVEEE